MTIPATWRQRAKAKAEKLLTSEPQSRHKLIINQIAEEEWRLDRLEWRSWMDGMRRNFIAKQFTRKTIYGKRLF